ncbi:preprotein translocase subunit SecG [Orbaceae bacterium ac157xtp]
MYEILIIAFLFIALAIVVLVLIQKGKGADMGASFGAGASGTLFGSAGTGNFLTRTTTILGILFFIVSLALANLSGKKEKKDDYWNLGDVPVSTQTQSSNTEAVNSIPNGNAPIGQEVVNPTSDIPE